MSRGQEHVAVPAAPKEICRAHSSDLVSFERWLRRAQARAIARKARRTPRSGRGELLMSDHDLTAPCEARREDAGEPGGSSTQKLRASRREFIKGVIASGVAVSAAGYVVVGSGG